MDRSQTHRNPLQSARQGEAALNADHHDVERVWQGAAEPRLTLLAFDREPIPGTNEADHSNMSPPSNPFMSGTKPARPKSVPIIAGATIMIIFTPRKTFIV